MAELSPVIHLNLGHLSQWGLNKMAATLPMAFSSAFSWTEMFDYLNKTSLKYQYWFRLWLGAIRHQAIIWTNVYLVLWHHMASVRFHELYKSLWIMSSLYCLLNIRSAGTLQEILPALLINHCWKWLVGKLMKTPKTGTFDLDIWCQKLADANTLSMIWWLTKGYWWTIKILYG